MSYSLASSISSEATFEKPREENYPIGQVQTPQPGSYQQYLTVQEEKGLVSYVLQSAENGFPLPVKVLRRLAWLIKSQSVAGQQGLSNASPLRPPGKNWPQALYTRHPDLCARRLKPIEWTRADVNIYNKAEHWFQVIGEQLTRSDILPKNVYNMDETGVMLGQSATVKMLVQRQKPNRTRGAGQKRTLVTAVECISATGEVLDPLIIWPASTHRSNWYTHPTPGWHFAYSDTGYTNKHISLAWITNVFDPQTRVRANGKPRLLISDGLNTHESGDLLTFCFAHNIVPCRLPSHSSQKLQPLDVGVFSPLKTAYREQVDRLYRGGSGNVGKGHFALLYSRARETAFTASNIIAAWKKAGLFPLDPGHVLSTMSAPVDEATTIGPHSMRDQNPVSVSLTNDSQITPITPTSFAVLRRKIEDAFPSASQSDRALIAKACNAGERAMTERTLLRDETKALFAQNHVKKIRASAPSTVVGKARVMSYEDIANSHSVKKPATKPRARGRAFAKNKGAASVEQNGNSIRTQTQSTQRADISKGLPALNDFCGVFSLHP